MQCESFYAVPTWCRLDRPASLYPCGTQLLNPLFHDTFIRPEPVLVKNRYPYTNWRQQHDAMRCSHQLHFHPLPLRTAEACSTPRVVFFGPSSCSIPATLRKHSRFEHFRYVRPEPVSVKNDRLYRIASKVERMTGFLPDPAVGVHSTAEVVE